MPFALIIKTRSSNKASYLDFSDFILHVVNKNSAPFDISDTPTGLINSHLQWVAKKIATHVYSRQTLTDITRIPLDVVSAPAPNSRRKSLSLMVPAGVEPPLRHLTGFIEGLMGEAALFQDRIVEEIGTGTGVLIPHLLDLKPRELHASDLMESLRWVADWNTQFWKATRRIRTKVPITVRQADALTFTPREGSVVVWNTPGIGSDSDARLFQDQSALTNAHYRLAKSVFQQILKRVLTLPVSAIFLRIQFNLPNDATAFLAHKLTTALTGRSDHEERTRLVEQFLNRLGATWRHARDRNGNEIWNLYVIAGRLSKTSA